jgi:hypothetical protein
MFKRRDTVIFRDYAEFCNATTEFGSTTDMSGWSAFHCDAPFILIAQETYRLFDMVELAIGQLLPGANIEFPYELRQDYEDEKLSDMSAFEAEQIRSAPEY